MKKCLVLLIGLSFVLLGMGIPGVHAGRMDMSVCSDGTIEEAIEYSAISKRQRPYLGTGDPADSDGVIPFDRDDPFLRVPRRDPAQQGPAVESVVGSDTRVRLYPRERMPSRAVALILFRQGTSNLMCTGWFIGPNTVATAGHCVHKGGGGASTGWSTNVRVYPAYDGSTAPYGYCTSKSLRSVTGWTTSKDEMYDYGAIKLNCTVGNTVGWYGFYAPTTVSGATVINGYPGDKPHYQQWMGVDQIRTVSSRQIFYKNDTYGGMSGSPVWNDRNGNMGPYAIGIHAYGLHGTGAHAAYNHGTRIVTAVYNNLVSWKNLP